VRPHIVAQAVSILLKKKGEKYRATNWVTKGFRTIELFYSPASNNNSEGGTIHRLDDPDNV
jgi:hypothetical protein